MLVLYHEDRLYIYHLAQHIFQRYYYKTLSATFSTSRSNSCQHIILAVERTECAYNIFSLSRRNSLPTKSLKMVGEWAGRSPFFYFFHSSFPLNDAGIKLYQTPNCSVIKLIDFSESQPFQFCYLHIIVFVSQHRDKGST